MAQELTEFEKIILAEQEKDMEYLNPKDYRYDIRILKYATSKNGSILEDEHHYKKPKKERSDFYENNYGNRQYIGDFVTDERIATLMMFSFSWKYIREIKVYDNEVPQGPLRLVFHYNRGKEIVNTLFTAAEFAKMIGIINTYYKLSNKDSKNYKLDNPDTKYKPKTPKKTTTSMPKPTKNEGPVKDYSKQINQSIGSIIQNSKMN